MDRPYIFCHMMTSVDGKIMGNYMDTKEGGEAENVFYDIAFGKNPFYEHQGWLSGRITTDDNFTFYKKPDIDENAEKVPEGDFIADNKYMTYEQKNESSLSICGKSHRDVSKGGTQLSEGSSDMYYVSVDPSGKLGWEKNTLTYKDTTAHIIEILTEKAENSYKAFLRKLNISYIVCGKDSLDYALAMKKLKDIFKIETLMLGGGGVLNWSFIQEGMCDELSIVMTSAADGSSDTPSLFETREMSDDKPVSFKLLSVDIKGESCIWLRYEVKNDQ